MANTASLAQRWGADASAISRRNPAAPDLRPLNVLRAHSSRQRAKAQIDLFQACALLDSNPVSACDAFAEALFRTLPQALGRRPRLYRAGSQDVSSDEEWLMALIVAIRRHDDASREFLLRSRVRREARRSVGFLAKNLAGYLDTV